MTSKKTFSVFSKAETLVKKAWFANLGLCSRSIEEAYVIYEKINQGSQKILGDLVQRGETVEAETKQNIMGRRAKLKNTLLAIKQRLTFKTSFTRKLDDLNAKIDELSQAAEHI